MMLPRFFTTPIVRRTSAALAVTALALGLAAGVLSQPTAEAAPAARERASGPDLVAGVLDFYGFETDERRTVGIVVMNNGTTRANNVEIRIVTGPGFISPYARGTWGEDFGCSVMRRDENGYGVQTCTTPGIDAGGHKTINLGITARAAGARWVFTNVDPLDKVDETDETNNTNQHYY